MLNGIRNGLLRSNTLLEKIMPLLTPAAIAFGVLNESRLLPFTWLVPWIFAFMTLIGSLKSNFRDLLAVLLKPQKLIILMVILHVVMPLIGWVAAKAFFRATPIRLRVMYCCSLFRLESSAWSGYPCTAAMWHLHWR